MSAAAPSIPIPTTAGIPIEALAPLPTATPPKPEMVAGKIPVGPEKTAETLPPTGAAAVAAENAKGPVLETIADHPIPPATGDEVLREIAKTADAKAVPDTETEAALEAKRQEVKTMLQELGKVLLEAGDTRASLAAIGLSAGDTPLADEFRQGILEILLMGGKPTKIEGVKWTEMQGKSSPISKEDSLLRKFFERHKFPLDMLDAFGGESAGAQQVLRQKYDEGEGVVAQFRKGFRDETNTYTPLARDLQREMGWNETNLMPTSHDALAKQFGKEEEFEAQMKHILSAEKRAERAALYREIQMKAREGGPGGIHALLIIASMFEGIVQQGSADAGAGSQQAH